LFGEEEEGEMQRPALGSVGQALTPLTPAGNVEVDGASYPAESECGEIAMGGRVVVTGFDPWCLFVRELVPESTTDTVPPPPPGESSTPQEPTPFAGLAAPPKTSARKSLLPPWNWDWVAIRKSPLFLVYLAFGALWVISGIMAVRARSDTSLEARLFKEGVVANATITRITTIVQKEDGPIERTRIDKEGRVYAVWWTHKGDLIETNYEYEYSTGDATYCTFRNFVYSVRH
jgi:hypothetical protein